MVDGSGEYLTAREAAERLGVKVETLYAYASRGVLASVPSGRGPARLYPRAAVERLRVRNAARRGGPPAGEALLRGGDPVLDSSITWLSPDEGPIYRGQAALRLAGGVPFEGVAELLWSETGEIVDPRASDWSCPRLPIRRLAALAPPESGLLERLVVWTAWLGSRDRTRFDTAPAVVRRQARELIRAACAVHAFPDDPRRARGVETAPSCAAAFAIASGVKTVAWRVAAIDAALVLLADHELNASAFAARVAASTGADLYACIGAGLCALTGPRHGRASERVWALVDEIGSADRAEQVVSARLRRGELIPGFGHTVYRAMDPRAVPLLELARERGRRSRVVEIVDAVIGVMERTGRPAPNVDVALVSFSAALGLAPASTAGLFAIARMAGWTAHVLEQHRDPNLLRPRARYQQSI